MSEITGAEVWLKFENLQFTAAYKERGALNKLLQLTAEERARGVIAASAGNHAQAVAYHAKRLGIPAIIVMPESTPTVKVTQTGGHGAKVVLYGDMFDDASGRARELALEKGYVFVHPFDDPQIIAGAGTVALEMLEDVPGLDTIVVPIGGGGLMSGVSIAAKLGQAGHRADRRRGRALSFNEMRDQHCKMPLGGDTLAEGIAVKQPGELTSRILTEYANDVVLVSERNLERAVAVLVRHREDGVRARARPALRDAFRAGALQGQEGRDPAVRRQHRHAFARQRPRPRPRPPRPHRAPPCRRPRPAGGAPATTAKVYEAGVHVLETHHSRISTSLPRQGHDDRGQCEARDPQSMDDVVAELEAAGFQVERASLD